MNKSNYGKLAKLLTALVGLFFVISNSFGLAAAILIVAFIFMVCLVKVDDDMRELR